MDEKEFSKIRVGLLIYTTLYSELLQKLLEQAGFTVVFRETDVLNITAKDNVDIVIIDPVEVMPGIRMINALKSRLPGTKTIIYTGANGRFFQDLSSRVDYYIYNTSVSALLEGILKVYSKDQEYIQNALELLKEKFQLQKAKLRPGVLLNDREVKLVEAVKNGVMKNELLAHELCLSVSSVKLIKKSICRKLGIKNSMATLASQLRSLETA